jgi:7-keto-8-aminopelargonate synthetase-like enzyme
VDERLKEAAIDGIRRFGITYPSSRAYVSNSLYSELENLVRKMYDAPIVLATSLSLGHHGVMPVVIEEGDAIIMDQQVHSSVQDAAKKLRCNGIYLDIVRHNQIDQLKAKIEELSSKHEKIWYLCDGVYSMYGDCAPMEELIKLADQYKNFYLYVDDAHGMTAFGKNGTGYVMSKVGLHPKMILSTGMAKAFGSIGGIFIIPDQNLCTKVKNCAGPLIFSGQQATPLLAASIASAKIHLSDEITDLQNALAKKIRYCHILLKKYHLPDISNPETPIFFIGVGTIGMGFNLIKRLIDEGFYSNIAAFPAVPEVNTGIRFTITNHLNYNDIRNFVLAIAKHFPLALEEEGRSIKDIQRAFKKVAELDHIVKFHEQEKNKVLPIEVRSEYTVQHETTIENISPDLWNELLGKRGVFTWESLKLFETVFSQSVHDESNWGFHYYIIRDQNNHPLLATFFTVALTKNDMLSAPAISIQIEELRKGNPHHQTTKTMLMGATVTEGNHLYIDRNYPEWEKVLRLLLDTVAEEQERQGAEALLLRDFDSNDQRLSEFLLNQGFLKTSLPDTHIIEELNWNSKEEFLSQFKHHRRQYLKNQVLKFEEFFDVEIIKEERGDLKHWYNLYKNVVGKSYEVNTFTLPCDFFKKITQHQEWEVIELKLKPEYDLRKERSAVAVMFCVKTPDRYCPLFVGIDYDFLDHNIYPQILWQTILRAKELKLAQINLGFTASQNKQKFGARAIPQVAYIQMKDNFNMSLLGLVSNETSLLLKSSK